MPASETVLITGASSGIGWELAKLFAHDGSNLILVARRTDRLEDLARQIRAAHPVSVTVISEDLGQPSGATHLYETLSRSNVTVDVLVNNAGFGAKGAVAELPLDRQLEMIQLNVTSLVHLTRLFLPGIRQKGRGGVLNVASIAAFQPGPYMAVYFATKAFVLHFTEALREELRETGLHITCLAPGPTDTGFAAEANVEKSMMFSFGVMTAKKVARDGYAGFRRNKSLVLPGFKNKLTAFAVRLVPRRVARLGAERVQK